MNGDDSENFKINMDTSTGKRSAAPQEPTRFTITGIPPSEPTFTVTFNNPSVREAEDPLQTTFQVFIPEDLLQVRRQNVEVYNYGGTSVTAEVCEAPKYCRSGNKLVNGYGWLNGGGLTWHHLLPQEFEALYPGDLDIHAAEYGLVINENVHCALHWSGWNKSWQDFFRRYRGRKPTVQQVKTMLNDLCLAYHGVAYNELTKAHDSYIIWGRGKDYVAWNRRHY